MEKIVHQGIILKTSGNLYDIQLTDAIQCSSCSIKSSCGLNNESAKVIHTYSKNSFVAGNKVLVQMKEKTGFTAVLLDYVIPFVVLITGLLLFSVFLPELKAAFFSLLLTALYYLILFYNKKRLQSLFQFEITKL